MTCLFSHLGYVSQCNHWLDGDWICHRAGGWSRLLLLLSPSLCTTEQLSSLMSLSSCLVQSYLGPEMALALRLKFLALALKLTALALQFEVLALSYKPRPCCLICDFLQRLSANFLQKTTDHSVVIHISRNDVRWQADIRSIILVYKLPLQPVMSGPGLGLDLKAKIFGLGHAVWGLWPCCAWPWPCTLWPC